MAQEKLPDSSIPSGNSIEYETEEERHDVVRILAMQSVALQEIYEDMLPEPDHIRTLIARAPDPQTARKIFRLMSMPMPRLTVSIWLLKEGHKSGGQILLPGGKIDVPNPMEQDILDAAPREMLEETAHTLTDVEHRASCDRTYAFTTVSHGNRTKTVRTNKESLVIAHIPRGQNTAKRFQKNENIQIPLRLSSTDVSTLLHREAHTVKGHTGLLLDSLSVQPERHEKYNTIINHEETIRTRNTIETEVWVFEAMTWKKLLNALDKTTKSKKNKHINKLIRSVNQMPEPTDIMSATGMIIKIRATVEAIERSYPSKRKPIKHRLAKQDYFTLLDKGIPKKTIRRRMVLMDELRVAYRAAFMGK